MNHCFSILILFRMVAGDLSPQCFNETQGINDNPDFETENDKLALTIQSIDQAAFCNVDNSNSDRNTIFCNIYYNTDIPNEIEEKCTALDGDYEEVGIFYNCSLPADTASGTLETRLYSTHHAVPTCTGKSCSSSELAEYSEEYFQTLELLYQQYNCEISYSDPLDDSSSPKLIGLGYSSSLVVAMVSVWFALF